MDYERLLLDSLDLVDQVVRGIGRRHRLAAHEEEELRDAIRLKLIENDYQVLRRFEQRCSLRAYLSAVVHGYFLDDRNTKWGKWRPSLQARRGGPVAMLLEQLLTRDGVPFDEAVEILRTNHRVAESPEQLYRFSIGFPRRTPRRFVSDRVLLDTANSGRPDDPVESAQHIDRASATSAALAAALLVLGAQDCLILKMRFQDNLQIAQIARVLRIDQKALYRRIGHVLKALRRALRQQGIGSRDIEGLIGSPGVEFEPILGQDPAGKFAARPSLR